MKNTAPADRIAAVAAFINAEDVRQGRPANVADRTAASLRAKVDGTTVTAYVDNNLPAERFIVLTLDEAATSHEVPPRNLTANDCVTVSGVTYVVFS